MRRTGPLEDDYLARLVSAFGIATDQVVGHQWVDNGPGWVGGTTTICFRGTAIEDPAGENQTLHLG